MTRTDALLLLGRLAAGFPGRNISDETVTMFADFLEPLAYGLGDEAIERLLEGQSFPTYGELKMACRITERQGDETRFFVASSEVERRHAREVMARVIAEYRERHPNAGPSPIFDDPDPDPVAAFERAVAEITPMAPGMTSPCTGRRLSLVDGHLECADGHCHDPDCTFTRTNGCQRNGESMRKFYRDQKNEPWKAKTL